MFARITGPESAEGPHTWVAIQPTNGGRHHDLAIHGEGAYEWNGRKVKAGAIVDLLPFGPEYRFFAPLTKVG